MSCASRDLSLGRTVCPLSNLIIDGTGHKWKLSVKCMRLSFRVGMAYSLCNCVFLMNQGTLVIIRNV